MFSTFFSKVFMKSKKAAFSPTLKNPEDIFLINPEELKQDIFDIRKNLKDMLTFSLLDSLEKNDFLESVGFDFILNHIDGSISLEDELIISIHPDFINQFKKPEIANITSYHLKQNFSERFNVEYDFKNNWVTPIFNDIEHLLLMEEGSLSFNINVNDIHKHHKIEASEFSDLLTKLINIKEQQKIINECIYIGSEILLSSYFEVDYNRKNCYVIQEEFDFAEPIIIQPFLSRAINLYLDNFSNKKNIIFTHLNKLNIYKKELNLPDKVDALNILKDKYILESAFNEQEKPTHKKSKRI